MRMGAVMEPSFMRDLRLRQTSRGIASLLSRQTCLLSSAIRRCGVGEFRALKTSTGVHNDVGGDYLTIIHPRRETDFRDKVMCLGVRVPFPADTLRTLKGSQSKCLTKANCEKATHGTKGSPEGDENSTYSLSDLLLQVVIFLFAAGFVDAGFSGDWSRIGVLTKETEGELQMAAVGIVPLAATLIWSISRRKQKS